VAILTILLDQFTKYLVITRLAHGQSWNITPWLSPILSITYVKNTGVAFGLFQGLGKLFVFVALAVIVLIILYYRSLPQSHWLLEIALGLQIGGAVGNNLIDRVFRGYVVDFIDVNFWPLEHWPVFNVADSSIVVGVIFLSALILWEEWNERHAQEQKQQPEPEQDHVAASG